MITEHDKALNKAKIQLMTKPDTTFFSTVCFSLKHVWDDSIPTACTNGKVIKYSPTFFMSLDADEQVFLLVHESMHVAYLHMDRLGGRDMQKWNKAADYVINLMLVERGFKMPKMGLLDHKYAGMSTEEVYKLLLEDKSDNQPFDMDLEPSDIPSEQLESDVKDILSRAAIASKMASDKPGSIPGDIEIFLDRLLNPKLPWNRILMKYLQSFNKTDYSYRNPNRRFFPKYHLPTLYGESLMDLTIAVDVSGSVSDHDFNVFVTEVASIFKMMKPETIKLIQFDTSIKSVTKVKSIQELMKCAFTGRGGTSVFPVIEWAKENKPQLLMIFSDGEFTKPQENHGGDTLWLIHNDASWVAPYGRVIHYTI